MKLKTTMYAHGSKESAWEKGEELGLKGEALQMFRHVIDEVEILLEVDTETGLARILAVDKVPLQLPPDPIDLIYPRTALEALAKWDAGESVFTVSMGGLGPGYEQCIHMMAFEIIRKWGGKREEILALPKGDKRWDAMSDAVPREMLDRIQPSGAQMGAAVSLAWITIDRGWQDAIRDPKVKDRLIQVSKGWPA